MKCPLTNQGGREWLIGQAANRSESMDMEREMHVAGCQECLDFLETQRHLWDVLEAWEPEPVSRDFDARLYARIAMEQARPWYRRLLDAPLSLSWKPAMPVAVACAAVLAVVLFNGPVNERSTHAPSMRTVSSGDVEIENIERALDDVDMLSKLGVVPQPVRQEGRPASI